MVKDGGWSAGITGMFCSVAARPPPRNLKILAGMC